MDWIIYALIPLATAFIGWLTNKVAIKMLFRPRRPVRALGVTWQGLVPRRQAEVAANAGEVIEREVLGSHWIRQQLEKVDLGPYLKEYAGGLIQGRLGPRLKSLPLVGGFINESTLGQLEEMVAEEMVAEAGPLVAKLAEECERHLDVRKVVEERIAGFEVAQLEDVVHRVAANEFRNIEVLGGVLGFLVGLLQLLLLLALGKLG